jgi:hypothetical protein
MDHDNDDDPCSLFDADNQSLRVFGSPVYATVGSATGYLIVQGLWR